MKSFHTFVGVIELLALLLAVGFVILYRILFGRKRKIRLDKAAA